MDVRKYEIYFECWPGYLTSEQSEQVRICCAVPKKKQHPRTKILLRKQGFRILEIYTKTIRGNAPLFSLSDI